MPSSQRIRRESTSSESTSVDIGPQSRLPLHSPLGPNISREESAKAELELVLSQEDPTNTVFSSLDGVKMYKASSSSFVTRDVPTNLTKISRLYGRTARQARDRLARKKGCATLVNDEVGLDLVEIEWLEKTRSSRIRFGARGEGDYALDVRIDEFLKSTTERSASKMFATPDGRTFKWKSHPSRPDTPAELYECADGRRVSGSLVRFEPATQVEDEDEASEGDQPNHNAQKQPGSLFICSSMMQHIDQIIVSWVIIERERRIRFGIC